MSSIQGKLGTPNDLKLSDTRSRHGLCRWAEKWWVEAQTVTAERVRCSAWLGVSGRIWKLRKAKIRGQFVDDCRKLRKVLRVISDKVDGNLLNLWAVLGNRRSPNQDEAIVWGGVG
jgi:hypothetical protein